MLNIEQAGENTLTLRKHIFTKTTQKKCLRNIKDDIYGCEM